MARLMIQSKASNDDLLFALVQAIQGYDESGPCGFGCRSPQSSYQRASLHGTRRPLHQWFGIDRDVETRLEIDLAKFFMMAQVA